MVDCDDEYICESARNFEERLKEHLKAPSPIYDHHNISGHDVTIDNFTILGREDQNLLRTIKEALYIRANNPSLNRNIWQVPPATYLGWGSAQHLRTEIKIDADCGNNISHIWP